MHEKPISPEWVTMHNSKRFPPLTIMQHNNPFRAAMTYLASGMMASFGACSRPRAVVYRGPASSPGCPESVAELLKSSPSNFEVVFAGPNEHVDVTPEILKNATVYAHGGGPSQEKAFKQTKRYKTAIRDFVESGGHYMGFCLGAYLAGHQDGYGLLPDQLETNQEIEQRGAQVKDGEDTVIQIDWTFDSGKTEKKRWAYFQDGVVILGLKESSPGRIIGRYSSNGDVAASVTPHGKGWVGLVGPHPEADKSWYDDENITNPDGIHFDIGYDFIAATLNGGAETQQSGATGDASSSGSRMRIL